MKVSIDSPVMLKLRKALKRIKVPTSAAAIARLAGVKESTMRKHYQKVLVDAEQMHVGDWQHSARGPFTALYLPGPGAPAPKPPRITDAETSRRWKAKTGYDELRVAARKLRKPNDPVLAALMGLPARNKQSAKRAERMTKNFEGAHQHAANQ